MVVVSACGDSQAVGEKGALRFQFGLFGCNFKDAGGASLATGGRTVLAVRDDATKMTTTMTVRSESPSALSLSSDGGVPLAVAEFGLTCSLNKEGVCTHSQGGVALSPVADGKARLVFERSGTLVDALTITSATPKSLMLREYGSKATTSLSTSGAKALTLEAVLKDGSGNELVATEYFDYAATGQVVINADTHQSGIIVYPADGGTGSAEVTARFGTLEAKMALTVKP